LGGKRQVNFCVRGQPGLQSEFQDSQGYTEKPCLKKKKKKRKEKKRKGKKKEKKMPRPVHNNTLPPVRPQIPKGSIASQFIIPSWDHRGPCRPGAVDRNARN
jgi:hypothetical protein